MAIPSVQVIQFTKNINPSGFRHIPASGKLLGTGPTEYLDFGNLTISTSGKVSDTKMCIFRVSDMGSASGIYDMKLYLHSPGNWLAGTYRFLYRMQTHWQGSSYILTTADQDLTLSIPAIQNLFSTSGTHALSGIFDGHVSQYIYLAIFADTDVPFASYRHTYRILYTFS